ncbi:zinc-dependent peptidase [Caenimonas sedimenti]|uniref:Zinc-dependent peptidase n=1 Tax=Caenimonas sedimenti TaxID=2596921 RepID=A0A562ZRZ9_9BURK|nr:M90 family metallopeptidase [Caenimonas sedimenti]TWO71116.1 zinc-dependent peptidase [Caenimonas sedimenti]
MYSSYQLQGDVAMRKLSSFAASLLRAAKHRASAWLPAGSSDTELPAQWRSWLDQHVELRARLPEALRLRHDSLVLEFVARKPFIGCAGLDVTEQMRVVIAGHACLLVLARGMRAYSHVREILLYPGQFVARRLDAVGDGLVHEHVQVLQGESSSLGQVVLSWADVQHSTGFGHNLVVHEFAHQLDQAKGRANGAPFTVASQARRQRWATIMSREFEQHQRNAALGEQTLLSHYGATNPAEFFAVCSEVFFELPQAMRYVHPAIYEELSQYYGLSPAEWFGAAVRPVTLPHIQASAGGARPIW